MRSIELRIWREAIGVLQDVSCTNERINATLAEVGIVVLPYKQGQYHKLLELEGRRVGILRTDDGYAVAEAV